MWPSLLVDGMTVGHDQIALIGLACDDMRFCGSEWDIVLQVLFPR